MSNLIVLSHEIYIQGTIVRCVIEQSNGNEVSICRHQWASNSYDYTIEDEEGNDIDITDIVSKEVKQIFSTIYHEQYQLKNL